MIIHAKWWWKYKIRFSDSNRFVGAVDWAEDNTKTDVRGIFGYRIRFRAYLTIISRTIFYFSNI